MKGFIMNKFMLTGVDAKIEMLFYNYLVSGVAVIRCWDDSIGTIQMKNFNINPDDLKSDDELEEVIKSLLNDNGFGCKDIIGAYIDIFASYINVGTAGTYDIWVKDMYIEKLEGQFTDEMKQAAYNYVNCEF